MLRKKFGGTSVEIGEIVSNAQAAWEQGNQFYSLTASAVTSDNVVSNEDGLIVTRGERWEELLTAVTSVGWVLRDWSVESVAIPFLRSTTNVPTVHALFERDCASNNECHG